jgi:competence protein ComEA
MGFVGGRAQVVALLALACAAGGAGALWQGRDLHELVIERSAAADEPADAEGEDVEPPSEDATQSEGEVVEREAEAHFVVHVDGAVGEPGVVELTGTDLRVYDAVGLAGGLLDDADTSQVNLAEPLSDGAKIHIPREGEQAEQPEGSQQPLAGQAQTSGATGSGQATLLVNINTATSEELQTLSGVGEATAQAIIEERQRGGPFAAPEDLMRVPGIGEKKFAKVKDSICV